MENTFELQKGFVPPQAIDIEEAVLAALLIDKNAIDEVMLIIKTGNVFYKESHRYIFEAVKSLFEDGEPIDMLTVSQRLKSFGKLADIGGDMALMSIMQKAASGAHADYHSRILMQKFVAREIIKFNAQTTALAYNEATDIFELLGKLQNEFDSISQVTLTGRKVKSFSEHMKELGHRIEFLSSQAGNNELSGVHTGFKRINAFTGGYQPQELIILAARPGMGKTSKVLKTVVENAKIGNAVGFVSLEMSAPQLTARIVAIDTNFHLSQLIKSGFEHSKYFESYSMHQNRMKDYKILIDDDANSDINNIVLKARYWKRVFDIQLFVVDYLQLMSDSSKKGQREQEISSISRRLKLLAKELNIPIIVLSQLSRAVETRGASKRPMLSDLRESGAIEQDADIVEFIYRPSYYKIEIEDEAMLAEGSDTEIIYAKNRRGSIGTTALKWIGDKTKFVDPTDETEYHNHSTEVYTKPLPVGNPSDVFDVPVSNEADDIPDWLKED